MNIPILGYKYQINGFQLFLILLLVQYTFLLLSQQLLVDDSLYYDSWGDQLSYERITKILADGKKWKWVIYVVLPLFTLAKCFFVAICLSTGAFFIRSDKDFTVFFKISLYAEFVLFLPSLVKIIWFTVIQQKYGLEDLSYFSPLSALGLFDRNEMESWMIYPLQLLNVFEMLYWFALAYQLKEITAKKFFGNIGFVASTYGVGLLIWVVFVVFLTVSIL